MNLRIILVGILLISLVTTSAQTINDIGKIVIGIKFQEGISQETVMLKPQLENKLVSLATKAGCSSFDNNLFFLSPNIVINNTDVAEGGMKNIYVVRGDLYLSIQDAISGTVFSSMSFPFKGSSTKKEVAIKNAILGIEYQKVESLFTEAKKKILAYYESKKNVIFTQSNTCIANGDYDGAIATLMLIPEELPDLYEKALLQAQKVYELRDKVLYKQKLAERRDKNQSVLTEANSLLAMNKPQDALRVLWKYTPGDNDQNALYNNYIKKAEKLVSEAERETLRLEERAYQDQRRREDRVYREKVKENTHRRDMDRRNMDLKKQSLDAAERVVHHKLSVDTQKVNALRQVASDYIRNNPNRIDYIQLNF